MKNLFKYLLPFTFISILSGCQAKDAVPKHVFFIVIDTLRADHLGCYGYKVPTSPTIDRLAKKGILFKNAYSNASSTLESVISFLISTTALADKVYTETLPPSYTSLQKCLKQAGYNTLTVISNPWLKTQKHLFIEGFNHYQFVGESWDIQEINNTTEKVTQAVLDLLGKQFNSSGKNFFYIHYLDPHDPYTPPVDYGFFSGKTPTDSLLTSGDVHSISGEIEVKDRCKKDPDYSEIPHPKPLSKNDLNYLISKYDVEIRHVDSNMAKLIARLQEMNILQDSLIVITSDHGEEFLEHGCFRHGFQLYEETIYIPLIFYWAGHFTPMYKENIVSGIDIAPTILELCKIKTPAHMCGRNILAKKLDEEPILFCTYYVNQKQRGMRDGNWKLIENLKSDETMIYNIRNDPDERNNLFDNNQKKWNHLFKSFERLLLKHAPSKDEKSSKKLKIDPETKEQLEALGYL